MLSLKAKVGRLDDQHHIDPEHKCPIPLGNPIAETLTKFFNKQLTDFLLRLQFRPVLRGLPHTLPEMDRWIKPMQDVLQPIILEYVKHGGEQARKQIFHQAHRQGIGHRLRRSVLPGRRGVFVALTYQKDAQGLFAFDVFRPEVLEFVRRWTYTFCKETNDTALLDTEASVSELRQQIAEGLSEGEAQRDLTRRVQGIFTDPFRAQRIATTEASRATHGGQLIAAKDSGVVLAKQWLASSDACPLCLSLAEMPPIPLEQDFAIDPKGGHYARIPHPPRHPFCMCAMTEVVGSPVL